MCMYFFFGCFDPYKQESNVRRFVKIKEIHQRGVSFLQPVEAADMSSGHELHLSITLISQLLCTAKHCSHQCFQAFSSLSRISAYRCLSCFFTISFSLWSFVVLSM